MSRENRAAIAAALSLIAFAALAFAVMRGSTAPFDLAVRNFVHTFAAPSLTTLMLWFTALGDFRVLTALAMAYVVRLATTGRLRAARIFLFAISTAEIAEQLLKLAFHRPRPQAFFGYATPATFSFPSGHASECCCFFGVIALIAASRARSPRTRATIAIAASLLVFAIGLSRIYLGVHHPTDVLAGFSLGLVWVSAASFTDLRL